MTKQRMNYVTKRIFIITVLGLLITQLFSSCTKEDIPEPEAQAKTVEIEIASDEFVGVWSADYFCNQTDYAVTITSSSDSTLILLGYVPVTITDGSFYGKYGTVSHYGEVIDGQLHYSQSVSGVQCSGVFDK